MIIGVFPWDNPEANQVKVWIDGEEMVVRTIIYDTPDIAAKYMYADSEITQEVHIQVILPSNYESCKNMYFATMTNDSIILKKERIKIKDILHQREVQYHQLLGYSFQNDSCTLTGWCAMPQPIQVKLFQNSIEIPCKTKWKTRAETRCNYPEYGYLPYSDYEITFLQEGLKNVILEFQTGTRKICKEINLNRAKKEDSYYKESKNGFTNYLRYRIYHYWNNGDLMDACKRILFRLISTHSFVESGYDTYDAWMKARIPDSKKIRAEEERLKAFKHVLKDYTLLQGSEGVFSADAQYEMAKAIMEHSDIDVLYTDEDVLTPEGSYQEPIYKPDYAPDYLRSMNYIGDSYLIRTSVLDRILHSINPEISIAEIQDGQVEKYAYEILLRCQEYSGVFYHIPRSLFHRREKKMTEDVRHIKYEWKEQPLVSILIPNKDHIQELDTCIRSIERQSSYRNFEYVIIENNSVDSQTFEYYKKIQEEIPKVKVLYYEDEFNFARINNYGAQYAKGDYFLLLNNDTEIIKPDSIWELLSYAMREDVGIVGARLYFPDDTIQHAGGIVGYGGVFGHAFLGADKDEPGYQNRIICPQNYSAVTAACLMVSRKIYEEVGGMSEEYKVAFNDVDFCLKVRELGYLIVYNPYAEFYHYESKSRGIDDTTEKMVRYQQEIQMFTERWKKILQTGDPYYNINLTLDRKDFSVNDKEIIDVSEK